METSCKVSTHQSTGLEKTITVIRGNANLGMTVSALRDGSGIFIRSVVTGGAISKDGRLKVGDGILAFNGEPTTNLTSTQARAMLRRHSLIGPELSVTYVPAAFLDIHREIQSKQDVSATQTAAIQSKLDQAPINQSKQEPKLGQAAVIQSKQEVKTNLAPAAQSFQRHKPSDTNVTQSERFPGQTRVGGGRVIDTACRERETEEAERTTRLRHDGERNDHQEREARHQILSVQAKGWREEETADKRQRRDEDSWSCPRRVTLMRTNGESLGISVIGGRGMGRRLSNGEMRRGIFIKHISEHSPAGRSNTLTPGDRILQVGAVNVSDFTHEDAVEAIRQAGDKVELLVQSPQVSDHVASNEDQSSKQNHLIDDDNSLHLSPSNPISPIPFKLTGRGSLRKPPHTSRPGLRLPSGSVRLLTDGVKSKNTLERLKSAQQGQVSYWARMLQKYAGLPGELKLVELDCSELGCGLGVCVSVSSDGRMTVHVSEIQPEGGAAAAAAEGQISVGDELLEINGQVLDGQNAAAVLNSASSPVKIVLMRNEAALKHTGTRSVKKAESPVDTDPGMNTELNHDASVFQEERMKVTIQKSRSASNDPPIPFLTSSNHSPRRDPVPSMSYSHVPATSRAVAVGHTHSIHRKQSYSSSMTNSSTSGVQRSSYCSACSPSLDPVTCPIIPGCMNIIDVCKGHSSLGLTIVGGCNTLLGAIVIHEVNEGGAAHRDGRLMAGDHILEVNGIDLRMANHEEALSVLRLSPQHVRLCVYRHISTHAFYNQATDIHEDMWDLFTVDLRLQPGQELGLNVVDKRNDTGIFVSEIRQGGVVESDGRLRLGDQILSVNGQDVRAVTQDDARTILQNCSGSVLLEVARFRATPCYSYECQNNLAGW